MVAVRGVSKMHRLYDRPQDRLHHALLWRLGRDYGREFWALSDVSLDARRGEAIGIVGRNGSGKSTLLQVIAGVLKPTAGEVRVAGRLAALLELGSGFNPDFTGRENVFFAGALLGMPRAEVRQRFDEIAAFADIGQFMDQPVRFYSSGMFLRLAFAVHSVLPKDVLLVDEALAVGDEAFQRKCFASLEAFRDGGGVVLFVSHSAQQIVHLATRAVLLEAGRVVVDGDPKQVTDAYHLLLYGTPEQRRAVLEGETEPASAARATSGFDPEVAVPQSLRYGTNAAEIRDAEMQDARGRRVNVLASGERCRWVYAVQFHEDAEDVSFGMMLKTVDGVDVAGINSRTEGAVLPRARAGSTVDVRFELRLNVAPGYYVLNAGVEGVVGGAPPAYLDRRIDVYGFRVVPSDGRPHHGIAFLEPTLRTSVREGR
jgi:lipopolysaccharide transport system ATP-binding protein